MVTSRLFSVSLNAVLKVLSYFGLLCVFFVGVVCIQECNPNQEIIGNLIFLGIDCINQDIDKGRSYDKHQTTETIQIINCFFLRHSEQNFFGGVIYVSDGTYDIILESCMFANCSSSERGGAIYVNTQNFEMQKVCANGCYASNYQHFAFVESKKKNYIEYLSFSYCSPRKIGEVSVGLSLGNQIFDNVNCSMNNAQRISGLSSFSSNSLSSSGSTFVSNSVSSGTIVQSSQKPGTITFANFINNFSPSYGIITVVDYGSLSLMYCIFKQNQKDLFCISIGSIEVSDSFISHAGYTTLTRNNSLTDYPSYEMKYYKTYFCDEQTPQIPSITINPTKSPSNESKGVFSSILKGVGVVIVLGLVSFSVYFIWFRSDDPRSFSANLMN